MAGKTRLIVVGALIDHQLLAQLLVVQRVDVGLGILFEQDLAHAEHASSPLPTMPTVNSRPGRYVSTSTGWW